MKKFFQRIFKQSDPGTKPPGVYNRNVKGRAARLGPAPSYWALIPVKPEEIAIFKKLDRPNGN